MEMKVVLRSTHTQHICTLKHMRSDRGRERESERASLANCQTKTNQLFPVCNTCIVVVVWCYKSLRWDRVENGRHTIVFVCGHIMAICDKPENARQHELDRIILGISNSLKSRYTLESICRGWSTRIAIAIHTGILLSAISVETNADV